MRFIVDYEDGFWCFQLMLGPDADSPYETFETDDLEEAMEEASRLVEELREADDPLASIFEED